MNTFLLPFIAGLTTGGVSCFAVQGGLLTSSLAVNSPNSPNHPKKILLTFLLAKLVAYTLLGFLLGIIGSAFVIQPRIQGWFQIAIGFYMLITAANLLDLHPFFRYFVIRPPKFILRFMRNLKVPDSSLVPLILGSLTILIPCGVTQGFMLLAVSGGSGISGALIMFSFILGTMPVFFAIGIAASTLFAKKSFLYLAAGVVVILGIISVNSGQILRGDVHTIQNFWAVLTRSSLVQGPTLTGDVVHITVTNHGYTSDVNTLKLGKPVKIVLTTNGVTSCARAFTIPSTNYFKVLPATGTTEIEFTPTKVGQLTYTCSMGMYSGSFNVVE